MNSIGIIGASGHAKVIIDILEQMKAHGQIEYDSIYLLDDDMTLQKSKVMNYTVIGKVSSCVDHMSDRFIIAIGNNSIRKKIAETYKLNYIIVKHPCAVIANSATILPGTVIMAGAVVNSDCKIGAHCIINTGSTVDHDSTVADFVHLSPGVHMGGTVEIGTGTWIGVGSTVINNIKIGASCIIGAGSVVIRNVGDGLKVVGNPARIIN